MEQVKPHFHEVVHSAFARIADKEGILTNLKRSHHGRGLDTMRDVNGKPGSKYFVSITVQMSAWVSDGREGGAAACTRGLRSE